MIRFLLGLVVGAGSSGVAWAVTQNGLVTAVIGVCAAVLVWFGQLLLDDPF
ncbi:hypothetical protein [Streptomyces lasiicapitis]|uniref:hypothetical protein n=1 Tax=Streptomyces lasiicapitis TaxID=1923961 RepID=UPI00365BA9F1